MFVVPAISRLIHFVSSESFHFWLSCLKDISLAECALINEEPVSGNATTVKTAKKTAIIESLSSAALLYSKAIAAVKVSL
jgi:hypothetical protein